MSGKKNLFDDNSDEDDGNETLTINKSYADRYEEWREAELKRQLEDRYGNAYEDVSSSSSDDDDDPEVLKKVLSKDFFEVISSLKTKDPKIYNSEVNFFQNEKKEPSQASEKGAKKKGAADKPVYLRDYERKLITERGGQLSDEDSEVENDERARSPTYVEEQRQLKESFKKVLNDDDNDSDEDGGLLKKKDKTTEEKQEEEEAYIEWLKGQKESIEDKETEKSLKPLQELWNDPKLDAGEKFLRDYILNKKYLESDDAPLDTGNVTDDDYQDEYMNTFERKYNFRFEEPDKEFLKRYPRTMEQSLRKKDTRRKERRDAIKQRKEEEKQKKREELKLLKSLKRKEIMKKIEKIKSITGNDELGLNPDELEDDFDPEAHDRKMRELFNDDYYQNDDEAEGEDGLNLPPLEEELLEDDNVNWDEWDGTDRNEYADEVEGNVEASPGFDADEGPHCEDQDFNMDCDYDPAAKRLQSDEKLTGRQSAREKRKLKRQSRFGRLVRKEKPVFDPNDKTFQQYVDEYYGMDYEDLIGDIACRFKYKSVVPNSFGLTIEEILAADDKELNQWASLKKAYTIRPDSVEHYESKAYALKAQNEELKRKILPSLYKNETENVDQNEGRKKKKKKKENPDGADAFPVIADEPSVETSKKKQKKRRKDVEAVSNPNISENAESSKISEDSVVNEFSAGTSADTNSSDPNVETSKKKKKKKRKMDADLAGNEQVEQQDTTHHAEGGKKKRRKLDADGAAAEEASHQDATEPSESSEKKKKKKKSQLTATTEGSSGMAQNKKAVGNGAGKPGRKSFDKEAVFQKNFKKGKQADKDAKTKPQQGSGQKQNMAGKKGRKSFEKRDGFKKKFQKQNQNGQGGKQGTDLSDERLQAFGLHPKKYRNKLKYGPGSAQ